jgi:hypothetical protein
MDKDHSNSLIVALVAIVAIVTLAFMGFQSTAKQSQAPVTFMPATTAASEKVPVTSSAALQGTLGGAAYATPRSLNYDQCVEQLCGTWEVIARSCGVPHAFQRNRDSSCYISHLNECIDENVPLTLNAANACIETGVFEFSY